MYLQSQTLIRIWLVTSLRGKCMARKVVWAAATIAVAILVVAVLTYYYDNYLYYSTGPGAHYSTNVGQLITPTDQADLNWGGYSVASSLSAPQPLVTGVCGSWVVPQIGISQNDTFSAVWIGIGGLFGHSLIQTGTEQDCVSGVPYYSAWYELLPNDSVTIPTIDVSPGDTILACVGLVNSTQNLWTICMSDTSTGQSYHQNFVYDSSQLSADWVVERPDVNNDLSSLANFGSVTISNCTVEMNNEIGALGYFPSARIFMFDTSGIRLADVSNYSSDGSSFTVTYLTSQ